MKTIFKYFFNTSLSLAVCLFMAIPAYAQRGGGGGGGHSGGGGGGFSGGHAGGGFSGGFSGGHAGFAGSRSSGFSGGRSSGFSAARSGAVAQRAGYGARTGTYSGRTSFRTGNYGRGGVSAYGHGYGAGYYGHGGWGHNYGWANHGGYFYSHGYYGSLYYPYLGFSCGFLPFGYYPFYWDDDPYYFSDGYYYQFDNDQYTVVDPPVGAAINKLPSDAQSIMINGQQFYEDKGVYYSPVTKDDGTTVYQIAGKDGELNTDQNGNTTVVPKIGDIVNTLPADCRKVKLNGSTFYVSEDGIYYQVMADANNNKVYKIVGLESDQNGN